MHIYSWYHSTFHPFFIYTNTVYNIHGAFPLLFVSPCWFPFVPLSNPLLLPWNPPSCDRIRPPRSQVACKLTSPVPTLSPNPPLSKFPEPQLPSASLRRPQESSGVFCPEQLELSGTGNIRCRTYQIMNVLGTKCTEWSTDLTIHWTFQQLSSH